MAGDIGGRETDAIVVNLFEGIASPGGATGAVDSALDGAISRLIDDGEITGKRGEVTIIHTLGKIAPARVVVAGLGKASDFDAEAVRSVSGETARRLQGVGVSRYSTIAHGAGIGGMDAAQSAQAIVEGTALGLYDFDRFKSSKDDGKSVETVEIVEFDASKLALLQQGVDRGMVQAEAGGVLPQHGQRAWEPHDAVADGGAGAEGGGRRGFGDRSARQAGPGGAGDGGLPRRGAGEQGATEAHRHEVRGRSGQIQITISPSSERESPSTAAGYR